jgi:hypothetical protein
MRFRVLAIVINTSRLELGLSDKQFMAETKSHAHSNRLLTLMAII